MVLTEFWPYWLARDGSAVTNNLVLDRMLLLTGPNMAGGCGARGARCGSSKVCNAQGLVIASAPSGLRHRYAYRECLQLSAGKSTVLRSVAAVALLANCGLLVPAKTARVPWCAEA